MRQVNLPNTKMFDFSSRILLHRLIKFHAISDFRFPISDSRLAERRRARSSAVYMHRLSTLYLHPSTPLNVFPRVVAIVKGERCGEIALVAVAEVIRNVLDPLAAF